MKETTQHATQRSRAIDAANHGVFLVRNATTTQRGKSFIRFCFLDERINYDREVIEF